MALLGEELNVTPMAAYRHVASKQELCDLVLDTVLARVAVPPKSSGDWMHRLTVMHADVRREVASVRGAVEAIRHRGNATPELTRLAEGVMAILRDAGFGQREAGIAFNVIHAYMSGQYDLDNGGADRTRSGLGAISSSAVAEVRQATDDEIFVYGFETVLLGLQARRTASRRSGAG
jgi:hypothetical protein